MKSFDEKKADAAIYAVGIAVVMVVFIAATIALAMSSLALIAILTGFATPPDPIPVFRATLILFFGPLALAALICWAFWTEGDPQ